MVSLLATVQAGRVKAVNGNGGVLLASLIDAHVRLQTAQDLRQVVRKDKQNNMIDSQEHIDNNLRTEYFI
jgi:hypothetical protein